MRNDSDLAIKNTLPLTNKFVQYADMWKVIKQLLLWLVAAPVALLTLLCALSERVPVAAGWLTAIIASIQHALASPWRLGFICVGVLGWIAAYFISDRLAEPKYQALRRQLKQARDNLSEADLSIASQAAELDRVQAEITSLRATVEQSKAHAKFLTNLNALQQRGELLASEITEARVGSADWNEMVDRIDEFIGEVVALPAPWTVDREWLYLPYFVGESARITGPRYVSEASSAHWDGIRKYVLAGVQQVVSVERQITTRLADGSQLGTSP